MNETVNYGTAILPSELDFVKEVVKPGDIMYVLTSSASKSESTHYIKTKILRTYKNIVLTSSGSRTWTDVVMGYRYTAKKYNQIKEGV